MSKIYKYSFPVMDHFTLELPEGAEVLSVGTQLGSPRLWAKVNEEAKPVKRRFRLFPTGQPMTDEPMRFIGTFQMGGGAYVFHLYELLPQDAVNGAKPKGKPKR